MFGWITKAFLKLIGGTRNDRIIRAKLRWVRERVNPLEERMQALSDEEMLAASRELRERLQGGESRESIKPEAFALAREACRRALDLRLYDVQCVAAAILDDGWIAEEATGEGKTFACYPAVYMAALAGKHTHLVTVNDYLVKVGADFAKPVFERLGHTVGYITSEMRPAERRPMYACDVTYGTNSEFGFDYLRDNMKLSVAEQVQSPLDYAIIDEVDNILIDEARTPLIISGPALGASDRYRKADQIARELMARHRPWDRANQRVERLKRRQKALAGEAGKARGAQREKAQKELERVQQELAAAEEELAGCTKLYEVELEHKSAHLTHEGVAAAQEIAGVGSFYVGANMDWPHLMEQALKAHLAYERDKDYVVQGGAVVIVDEFTGRLMEGRQWSDGLHQAVEAKERVEIKEETQTIATITLQNYFKLYAKLAGMTGTAMTEADEFLKIYKLDCASVPTNRPCVRQDYDDRIYATTDAKYKAIAEEINEVSKAGRPVLVGTTSIEKSERISDLLTRQYGVVHEVLNARPENAAREAEIVARAGQQRPLKKGAKQMVGNVTIATNMAGRGTDIKLAAGVAELGGLHIVGTERHEARRIDNQLRGRSGRQGDPGSSRFFLSLEDELLRIFAGPWVMKALGWLGLQGDNVIEHPRISKGLEKAQKRVEQRNFEIRKNLLEYDEVMDYQRRDFYARRQRALEGDRLEDLIHEMLGEVVDTAVADYLDGHYARRCIAEWARQTLQVPIEPGQIRAEAPEDLPDLEASLRQRAKDEASETIAMTLGEYMDPDLDRRQWDLRGLSSWAMSRFRVELSQNQLRKMQPDEVQRRLSEAAGEQIDRVDCAPLLRYLEEGFAAASLAQWARAKFGVEVDADELGSADEAATVLLGRVQQAYRRREVEVPVEYAMDITIGQGGADNVYALENLAAWANRKYDAALTGEALRDRKPADIRRQLVELSEQWLRNGRLEQAIHDALGEDPSPSAAAQFARERFDTELDGEQLDGNVRGALVEAGRQFLRREMTELERFVLLQILDGAWKDHLLAMDHLKGGIGLRGYAEQDPRVAYKREGSRLYDEMLDGVRDKVAEMIFKVRLGAESELRSVYEVSNLVHEQLAGYDHLARDMAAQEAAARGQMQKVQTIVRDAPKVGRNDPCPCGSGKKYKNCCGRNA